jgi:8-oxo-dGTP pyrophosphatase MutT (NUDIX family)
MADGSNPTPVVAAGILIRSPAGRVLLLRRAGAEDHEGEWSLPGGRLKQGEDHATAAVRETFEELGWHPGSAGTLHCRRVRDGVDYTTFLKDVDHEFSPPHLNHEHDAWAWVDPEDALTMKGTPP